MIFVLFLIYFVFSSTNGGWLVVYNDGDQACEKRDKTKAAINLVPECVSTLKVSQIFQCEENGNITSLYWGSPGCNGKASAISEIGKVNECHQYANLSGSFMWKCEEDFKVTFSHLTFEIPYDPSKAEISPNNPVIWREYIPINECIDFLEDRSRERFIIFKCDGKIEVYSDEKCHHKTETHELAKGEFFNSAKLLQGTAKFDIYWKFVECKREW